MGIHLECPHCQCTHTIKEWNKEVVNSITLSRATQLIPENLDYLGWEEFASKEGGTVDCPSCGEVCCYEDMMAC